jgi:hypothetical protein
MKVIAAVHETGLGIEAEVFGGAAFRPLLEVFET